jgi:hypothetical protein
VAQLIRLDVAGTRPVLATSCEYYRSIEFASNRRAGILPKRNAMSKRIFLEIRSQPPHIIHSFSTTQFPGVPEWEKCERALEYTRQQPHGEISNAEISTVSISTSRLAFTQAMMTATTFPEARNQKLREGLGVEAS